MGNRIWKILVVDDDEVNLKIAIGVLKYRHMVVDVCSSGKEALYQVDNCEYDLILLDHVMPEMDGMRVLEKIRKGGGPNAHTMIVVLTSYTEEGLNEAYCQAGFDGYICKPLTLEKVDEINQMLSKKHERDDEKRSVFGVHSEVLDYLLSCQFDIAAGMDFAKGNVMLYQETLQMFGDKAASIIEKFTNQRLNKNYSTYKAICENQREISKKIGATALYNRFYKHIIAVNNGDYSWLDKDYEEIVALWRETANVAARAAKI